MELPIDSWGRIILFEVAVFSSIAILTVLGGSRLQPEELSQTGGRVGWGLAEMLRSGTVTYRSRWNDLDGTTIDGGFCPEPDACGRIFELSVPLGTQVGASDVPSLRRP